MAWAESYNDNVSIVGDDDVSSMACVDWYIDNVSVDQSTSQG